MARKFGVPLRGSVIRGRNARAGNTGRIYYLWLFYTSGARNYAQNLGGGLSLVLIDGERLACLMIKYRVGVQVARTYTVMKLDEDFFKES